LTLILSRFQKMSSTFSAVVVSMETKSNSW
jgi:hypothetical protein